MACGRPEGRSGRICSPRSPRASRYRRISADIANAEALVARNGIAGFERVAPTADGEGGGDPYWQVVLRDVTDRLPVSRRQWSVVKGLVS